MTLPLPKLDARRYDDLVAEALRRIPRFTPEYTDHNPSDPGMALIGVNAWLTETLLYQINRVPEQNYVAFLNLLGVKPRPARAAQTELAFQLKPQKLPTQPLAVTLPAATRVAVDDPELETEVVFETGGSVQMLDAAIGLALVPDPVDAGVWGPVTRFDGDEGQTSWLHAFNPFSANEATGNQFLMALVLRPQIDQTYDKYSQDRLPSGALDVYVEATEVFEPDPEGADIAGPLNQVAGPVGQAPDTPEPITWEIFTGSESKLMEYDGPIGWQAISVALDETRGLTRSGHLTFDIPAGATPVRFGDLPPSEWDALRLNKPPQSSAEFIALLNEPQDQVGDLLRAGLTPEILETMGLPTVPPDGIMNDVVNVCKTGAEAATKLQAYVDGGGALSPKAIAPAEWSILFEDLAEYFAGPEVPIAIQSESNEQSVHRRMYFIRATLDRPQTVARMLNAIRLNTVSAVAASTRADERLGQSNGRPGQEFTLTKTPVYFDPASETPDLELAIIDGTQTQIWQRVEDFYGATPDAQVFTLDPIAGVIRFGDGRPKGIGGAIPPPNATILAKRYRFGGGSIANVGAGTITKIKGSLKNIDGVFNRRAAGGADDAESLAQVLARAPSTLRSQDRAVSASDFSELARQTPGAAIHKAYALAATSVETPVAGAPEFTPRPGAVTVVVLPAKDHPTPQPNDAELTAVQSWLEPRRLVTTELFVTGPRYFTLTHVAAELRLRANADFETVSQQARTRLTQWLHPITGGDDGTGWPFGRDLYFGDIYDLLLAVEGVSRVSKLGVTPQTASPSPAPDVIPIPPGHLPALQPGAIDFRMVYDNV